MRRYIFHALFAALLWARFAPAAPAQEPAADPSECWSVLADTPCWEHDDRSLRERLRDRARGGDWSLQTLAGYYPMSSLGSAAIPFGSVGPGGVVQNPVHGHLDFAPTVMRLGYEFPAVWFPGTINQGRIEILGEYLAAPITRGYGHFLTGPSTLLRYNYCHEGCRLVPYLQGGGGLLLNDAYHDGQQRLIGGPLEFLLQAQVGVRYFISPCCSIDIEGGYVHISNADMYARNVGVNSFGGSIGMTFYFGRAGN